MRRAVAELLGSVLRRVKGGQNVEGKKRENGERVTGENGEKGEREKVVLEVMKTMEVDVSSWVFVEACKSVSQTLHTVAGSVFGPLVRYYLDLDSSSSGDEEDRFDEAAYQVGEQEEKSRERLFREVVRRELHRVRADNRDVLVASRGGASVRSSGGSAKGGNAVLHVLRDLDANLHPCTCVVFADMGRERGG